MGIRRSGHAPRVLVADAEGRAALAACRGLAAAGYAVSTAASERLAPALWSRACERTTLVPYGLREPNAFAAELRRSSDGVDVVLPASDLAVLQLSHVGGLRGVPSAAVADRVLDKRSLADPPPPLAAAESVVCTSRAEIEAAARRLGFPVLLKPATSIVRTAQGLERIAGAVVGDAAALECRAALAALPALVQRFERGGVVSYGGVRTSAGVVGLVASRWSRRWPPPDGAVTFCETVEPDEHVAEAIDELLRSLGYEGIFELELLETAPNRLVPVDLNPRPFGWMALALAAGVNLPAMWCDSVRGLRVRPSRGRAGVRYRWEDGDLRHLFWQLRRGRLTAAAAVTVPRRRVTHAYFGLRDPAPAAAALLQLGWRRSAGQAVRRRIRRRA
jgi:hypothetical protein